MKFTHKHHLIILGLILILGFVLRLYRFDNPIADWHSWRQADTSAVSRNFVKNGFDIMHPRFDDLSNVPSGIDNPHGYRFVEFPIFNIKQAFLFKTLGFFTLEQWGRLVSIFGSLVSGLFLYFIVGKYANKITGLFAAFFYILIPYNIYYGRTILPDTLMVTASLGGIYFFDLWSAQQTTSNKQKIKVSQKYEKSIYFVLSLIFTASAFLLKPYALIFTLPILVIAFNRFGIGIFRKWQLWVYLIAAVTPFALWRYWITQFPEGVPASDWLYNGNGIRFRPAFFRWIIYERLTKLIGGYLGIIIFFFGIFSVTKLKHRILLSSFLVSSMIYVTVFATGNVQHDYYQILIMPSVAIFFAIGSNYLISKRYKNFPAGLIILLISVFSLFWFGWAQVKDYFNINNRSIIAAGKAIDRIAPKDAKVIANYTGDTSFLYQTNRQGWASFQNPLPEMIQKGADYLILVNPVEQDLVFGKTYKTVEKTSEYVIFDLRTKP